MTMKTIISGIQPSGHVHIGNYFGAMKQFVDLQDTCDEMFIFIADYHALTSVKDPALLKDYSRTIVLDYLAIGLDPEKVTLFRQSDVPEHTELAWIFNCITTMPFLMRAHAFKDAEAKNKEINVGKFTYPLLMASDILLYDASHVPVGQDQKQHIEITRDTAEKFNTQYGKTFTLPEAHILDTVKIIPGTNGEKMSKSYNNVIPLFASDEELEKAIMSIATASNSKGTPNDTTDTLFSVLSLFLSKEEVASIGTEYQSGNLGYKDAKELLIQKMIAYTAPMKERRKDFEERDSFISTLLEAGAEKARTRTKAKMKMVRERIGIIS